MRRLSVVAASLLTAIALAACSGSTASPSGAPSTVPSAAPSAPSGGGAASEVMIKDFAFAPADLSVTTGTTVTWTNQDSAPHTVTFEGGPKSGNLDQGATYQQTFDAPGTFPYVCSIHASMKGTVTVTN